MALPGPSIWIIVPTYNERENVGPITEAILGAVPEAHILIVDDGSPDGTGELADEMAARNPAIAVLHRQAKQGLGRAYVAAFKHVLARDAAIVVQMDADFSHPVRFLASLLEPIRTGRADLVLGSRYVRGGVIPRWSLPRRVISRGGSLFAQVVLLLRQHDLTGGFKAWRAEALQAIDLERLHAGGYAFQIETTFRAHRAGARIVEVPITFEERNVGQSKMTTGIIFEALRVVLGLRLSTLRPTRSRNQAPTARS
ncbi:MAG: polyprenol monophosphomannose synthase [Candidatus Limnocylindrales bacterium]